MTSGVITIGRRQYASGLYWENAPSGRVSQSAKEAARQPGQPADFYAVRGGNKDGRVPQFGLSRGAPGHKAGMPALAACIANQQPGSWVGAFRLREGTAVVVVRDDLIVPDGDLFFEDETEARDRLLQEMALGGLQRIYAPESWGVPGADTMPVSLLINDRVDVRLRPVALSRQGKLLLLGGAGLLVVVLGVGWYMQKLEAEAEAERLAQQAALERARLAAQQAVPGLVQKEVQYPPPERKWEKRPPAADVLSACRVALSRVPLALNNWRMDGVKCDDTALSVRWSRSSGFALPPPDSTVNETGTAASATVVLPTLTPRGDEELGGQEYITRRFMGQNWTGTIARAPDDPPPPPPPNFQGKWEPPPPPWVKRSFTLNTPVLPWTLPIFFEGIPGVVITSLSSNGTGGAWTIEGVIYENRR